MEDCKNNRPRPISNIFRFPLDIDFVNWFGFWIKKKKKSSVPRTGVNLPNNNNNNNNNNRKKVPAGNDLFFNYSSEKIVAPPIIKSSSP